MSSIIKSPTQTVGAFESGVPAAQPGEVASVNAAAPPRFMTTPEVKRPYIPTKEQLASGPNAVPFDVFFKITKGNPALAEKMCPGITKPNGYMLWQPDAATGVPLVKLHDPVGFARMAHDSALEAASTIDRGGVPARDLTQGVPLQMDSAGNAISADEIKRRDAVKGQDLPVEPSEVQPSDILIGGDGAISIGMHVTEAIEAKTFQKLARRAAEIAEMHPSDIMKMSQAERGKIVGEFADFMKRKLGMKGMAGDDMPMESIEALQRAHAAKALEAIPKSVGELTPSAGPSVRTAITPISRGVPAP